METMGKIKVEDLSVGDWVRTKDGNVTVDIISPLEVVVMNDYGNLCACKIEDIKPIPITAEILEKNGLEYEDDGNDAVIFLCCDMFWARLCIGDTFWQVGIHSEDRLDAVVCAVKHTHQLQHALRLAGVGKEIVL